MTAKGVHFLCKVLLKNHTSAQPIFGLQRFSRHSAQREGRLGHAGLSPCPFQTFSTVKEHYFVKECIHVHGNQYHSD